MNEYYFSYLSYIFVTQVTLKWVVFTHSLLQCMTHEYGGSKIIANSKTIVFSRYVHSNDLFPLENAVAGSIFS